MMRLLLSCVLLASACASSEMRSAENDPANPSATVAALDVGAGVLSSSFSPDALAAETAGADPHAGHDMSDPHAHHQHASTGSAADPHAGHEPTPPDATSAPTSSSTASSRPKAPPKKAPPPPAATTYTCMHHPEVVSTTPGQCPKCGMDLVPAKPAPGGKGQP